MRSEVADPKWWPARAPARPPRSATERTGCRADWRCPKAQDRLRQTRTPHPTRTSVLDHAECPRRRLVRSSEVIHRPACPRHDTRGTSGTASRFWCTMPAASELTAEEWLQALPGGARDPKRGGIDENRRYRAGPAVGSARGRLLRCAGGIASELLPRIRARICARPRESRRRRARRGHRALRHRLVRWEIAAITQAGSRKKAPRIAAARARTRHSLGPLAAEPATAAARFSKRYSRRSAHRVELTAEPARERPGRLGRQLLGGAGNFAALLRNGLELTSGMRGRQLHELGDRLRLQRVLRVFEHRVDVGLSGREDPELIFPESLGGFRRTLLQAVGSFASGLGGFRRTIANGVARSSLSGFAVVHGASSLAMSLVRCRMQDCSIHVAADRGSGASRTPGLFGWFSAGASFRRPRRPLVTPAGLEPATNRLEGCCSIRLSYGAEGILGNRLQRFEQIAL